MRIVFFSTNSNHYAGDETSLRQFPSNTERLRRLRDYLGDNAFSVATAIPGSFLRDTRGSSFFTPPCGENQNQDENQFENQFDFRDLSGMDPQEAAETIAALNPDFVIAVSAWVAPFDWLGLMDAMTSDILRERGIPVLCTSAETQMLCFDKNLTHKFLIENSFPCPPAIYVHHELFWAERGRKEIIRNVYRDYIFSKVRGMEFPVVIKDTVGLSSYGMEVAVSYKETLHYLKMGKTKSDRMVEKYIRGLHFGSEIYGTPGNYFVADPFIFSLNRFGITSPKLSVKIGPIGSSESHRKRFKIPELKTMLASLAEKLGIQGAAQVDLVFDGEKWLVIEINPRLSGLTESYCTAYGKDILQTLADCAMKKNPGLEEKGKVCCMKIPLQKESELEKICRLPHIRHLKQIFYSGAKQEREKGYCEIIFGPAPDFDTLSKMLDEIKSARQDIIEEIPQEGFRHLLWELRTEN